ncbi:MAG: transposase [Bacteroidales bacterium]|nr:transposase [Bacteroidales bacterium]
MSVDKYLNKYRVPSARASWHNYSAGVYFVTICTHKMEHYFGKINSLETKCTSSQIQQQPTMILSEIGKYADEQFANVQSHYPYVEIPLWVVMPNHIHCIVMIDSNNETNDNSEPVETMCTSFLTKQNRWKNDTIDEKMQNISLQRGKLSTAIGGIKRAISHFANENKIPFAWQPRFHDRIIRDTDELNRIADYINNNVAKWDSENNE